MLTASQRNLSVKLSVNRTPIAKMNQWKAHRVVRQRNQLLRVHLRNIPTTISGRALKKTRILGGMELIHVYLLSCQFKFLSIGFLIFVIVGGLSLLSFVYRSFDEPTWGTFYNNDDADSVWGFSKAKVSWLFEMYICVLRSTDNEISKQ